MSADSTLKQHKPSGTIIRPQLVSDTTVIESVVNFIQDVVPSYANNQQKVDDREKILWLDFQNVNGSSSKNGNGSTNARNTLLQLVIGYSDGIQCWVILESGEAYETLSLRNCSVRFAKLLPTSIKGVYSDKAPLMIVCDASSTNQPYCNLKLLSLKTADVLISHNFASPVVDLKCNKRVIAASFSNHIIVFDSKNLKEKFKITSCYPCPGICENPTDLSDRWIAYADNKLVPMHQSSGGMAAEGRQSYTATMISAAKTISKGLTIFSETVATTLTGQNSGGGSYPVEPHHDNMNSQLHHAGVVTILDVCNVKEKHIKVSEDNTDEGLVAHFPAHIAPVSTLTFNSNGSLLLTTDKNANITHLLMHITILGHDLFIFRIMAHPRNCSLGAVHHLYTLHRGDTTAKVQDVCFTNDSRWVAITTLHGTTHIFPITPYGGNISARTHVSTRVVNRSSKFQRSAGLDDLGDQNSSRRRNKSTGNIPVDKYIHKTSSSALNNNARLPPFPHPININSPITQFKHGLSLPGINNLSQGKHISRVLSAQNLVDTSCVSVCFAASRGYVAGAPEYKNHAIESSLLNGQISTDKDRMLDVSSMAKAQWSLIRSKNSIEIKAPLQKTNALLMDSEKMMSVDQKLSAVHSSIESLSSSINEDDWLSQVEITTHIGPHRRLWMGPQFSFQSYQSVVLSDHNDTCAASTALEPPRKVKLNTTSNPVLMPNHSKFKQNDCLYIQSGSYEHQPIANMHSVSWQESNKSNKMHDLSEEGFSSLPSNSINEEDKLCECIADAMLDSSSNHFSNNFSIEVDSSSDTPSSSYSSMNSHRLLDHN